MTFEQILKGGEGVSQVALWKKSVPGRGNCLEPSLEHAEFPPGAQKASVARGTVAGNEVREVIGTGSYKALKVTIRTSGFTMLQSLQKVGRTLQSFE